MISSARTRRQFLQSASAATLLSLPSPALFSSTNTLKETQFYTNLSCGRIGAKATFLESVELAVKYGFEAVDPDAKYFAQLSDSELANLLEDLKAKKLKFGSGSLPVDFRKDETTFGDGLKRLPEFCRALRARSHLACQHVFSVFQ